MTKENDKLETEETLEKSEWQKRHEEFLARQEAKKAAEEEENVQEEEEIDSPTESEGDAVLDLDNQGEESQEESSEEDEDLSEQEEEIPLDKASKKALKEEAKRVKKAKALELRSQRRPVRRALAKLFSIILLAFLVLLGSLFVISPLSKSKAFTVTGLDKADKSAILVSTGIRTSDYISTVFFNQSAYEKAIVEANPWVKQAKMTYEFPNKFNIAITENRIIAYAQTSSGYQPVLENGVRMPVVSQAELPPEFLTVNLTDKEAVQTLVTELAKLDQSLVSQINSVDLVETSVTKDLLQLTMTNGVLVRVPLSQIAIKLPYYSTIATSLTTSAIVDMEVGIYVTNADLEAVLAQEKAERDQAKKEAEEAAKAAEAAQAELATEQTTESSEMSTTASTTE
ncbi:cell division protein FtsQ/DivIB [Streptococcus plurextorum]|uniref:cell division protein FtsQ/DivIB n=1 Tax=Streptococcus plurextorum TaxID=456876 RepID=UPI0003F7AE81|nr:FtsQ-type POTRA domain-containing protein [Streptococcus plurextorum]